MSKLNMNVKPEKTNEITISKQTSSLKFIERANTGEWDQLSRPIGGERMEKEKRKAEWEGESKRNVTNRKSIHFNIYFDAIRIHSISYWMWKF